jgi:hypothetical protein
MDKGTEIYQELIDGLVEKSKNCVGASWARKGKAVGTDELITKLNALFEKLSEEERETIAQFVADEYMSGIYDTLTELEWYVDCRDMKISVEDEELPTQKYEGIGNDFIGRRSGDWEWREN